MDTPLRRHPPPGTPPASDPQKGLRPVMDLPRQIPLALAAMLLIAAPASASAAPASAASAPASAASAPASASVAHTKHGVSARISSGTLRIAGDKHANK